MIRGEVDNPCLKLAVFKFASCDGCQLSLLAVEDQLLELAERVDVAYFLEATSHQLPGPYDVALVEGSITTPDDAARIREVRRVSRVLVTIGACATAGGIQALRNWADSDEYVRSIYATPQFVSTLTTSTAIADHVLVDFELRGCPINKLQLIEVLRALLAGRKPRTPAHSVCLDCKRQGTVCVMVARGVPCLGPVTQAGCGAICPYFDRGCYGCYGPASQPNLVSLTAEFQRGGVSRDAIVQSLRTFNANAAEFRAEGDRLAGQPIDKDTLAT